MERNAVKYKTFHLTIQVKKFQPQGQEKPTLKLNKEIFF